VIAVEPDPAMRAVLSGIDGLEVREGTGEHLPLEDASVDAVIASSSWHWVEPSAGVAEAARVLTPRGTLAAMWTGPDPDGVFAQQAKAVLGSNGEDEAELNATVSGERTPGRLLLEIPDGLPFSAPVHQQFGFVLDLTADQLIGMLSTLSWVILMDADRRDHLLDTARRLLRDALGVEGPTTIAVDFICDAYRSSRT
jgi:SAM-dependent methyltransferase